MKPVAVTNYSNGPADRSRFNSAAFYLTYASAVCILFSIALSQILLGASILALVLARQKMRCPPVKVPLALFIGLTVIAVLLSPHPAAGWPQIRKFYVFAILPMVFTTFSNPAQIRSLTLTWSGVAFLSAIQSAAQYVHRYHLAIEQNAYDYGFFLDGRVTGFASHWMTFGGEQMIVLLLLMSCLLFGGKYRRNWLGVPCALALWISILLGLTRSVFLLGVPVGACYLFWKWKRWVVAIVPAALLIALLFGPVQVRERLVSAIVPHRELDSNTQRSIARRTGWEMVKAHPLFGLGPEQVAPNFVRYLPADVARPLPKGYYGHLHNIYLQYAAERGVPALLVLLWLIGRAVRDFHRGSVRHAGLPTLTFVLHGAIATILAVLAEGFFEYNLGDSEVLTLFLVVVAGGYRTLESAATEVSGLSQLPSVERLIMPLQDLRSALLKQ